MTYPASVYIGNGGTLRYINGSADQKHLVWLDKCVKPVTVDQGMAGRVCACVLAHLAALTHEDTEISRSLHKTLSCLVVQVHWGEKGVWSVTGGMVNDM